MSDPKLYFHCHFISIVKILLYQSQNKAGKTLQACIFSCVSLARLVSFSTHGPSTLFNFMSKIFSRMLQHSPLNSQVNLNNNYFVITALILAFLITWQLCPDIQDSAAVCISMEIVVQLSRKGWIAPATL